MPALQALFAAYQTTKLYWEKTTTWDPGPANTSGFPSDAMYHDAYANKYYWLTQDGQYCDFPPADTLKSFFGTPAPLTVFPLGIPTDAFYNGFDGWPALTTYTLDFADGCDSAVHAPSRQRRPSPPPALGPDVRLTVALSRDPNSHEVLATVTLTNRGTAAATNLALTAGALNVRAPLDALPTDPTRLAAGAATTLTVRFPALTGKTAVLRLSGTFRGGTFGGSLRLPLP